MNTLYPAPVSENNYLESMLIPNVADTWVTVSSVNSYTDPVVVRSVQYVNNSSPVVTRLRHITSTNFDLRLQNPGDNSYAIADDVHCMMMESGEWQLSDGRLIEAQHYTSAITDYRSSWNGEPQSYLNQYTKSVVLG